MGQSDLVAPDDPWGLCRASGTFLCHEIPQDEVSAKRNQVFCQESVKMFRKRYLTAIEFSYELNSYELHSYKHRQNQSEWIDQHMHKL